MNEILFALAVVLTFLGTVAHYELRLTNLELKRDAEITALEFERPQMCGASDGWLHCSLEPHDTDWHIDFSRSTQYSSATFRSPTPEQRRAHAIEVAERSAPKTQLSEAEIEELWN